jgi:DNA-binding NarL/FixJ family response regulator
MRKRQMNKIRILLADDHVILRKGLKQIMDETDDLLVAGEAGNGVEVLEKIRSSDWDVLVLDIAMPGLGGIDVLKRLHDEKSDLPVLVLSTYPPEQYALRLLKSGAAGYMTKESAPDELVLAIRQVAGGRKYISPSVAELLSDKLLDESTQKPHELLSEREFQVMCQIAKGKTVSEIADVLSLSVKTISTYRSRILTKMHMKNNAELTHYAIKSNLVD